MIWFFLLLSCFSFVFFVFFFNDTATTEIYTLSLHDALPIWKPVEYRRQRPETTDRFFFRASSQVSRTERTKNLSVVSRSEEHTSELQSRRDLVCRLLLEKKKKKKKNKKKKKTHNNESHNNK